MSASIRFRYNPVFLPEYFSTFAISIPISAYFLTTRGWGGVGNANATVAVAIYLVIALLLILLTIFYRVRYRKMTFITDELGDVILMGKGNEFNLTELDRVEERIGKFFGRKTRMIHLEDARGFPFQISESLVDYAGFKRILTELSGKEISAGSDHPPEEAQKIARLWQERHQMFPAPRSFSEAVSRLGWRCVCLLPVGLFDVLINVVIILSLTAIDRGNLMAYSAPISLVTSGLVARYVYYYMFTSTAMNKPIGA